MSGAKPEDSKRASSAPLRTVLLLAGCTASAALWPALAQQTGTLRGSVAERSVNDELLSRRPLAERATALTGAASPAADEGIPVVGYEPATEAVEPADGLTSPGDEMAGERTNTFAEPVEAAPRRRPTTAMQRAEEAASRARRGPASDADRERLSTAVEDEQDSLATGTVRAGTVDSETDLAVDPRAEAEAAIEGIDRDEEDDPFAPVGITVGSFILRPSLESGITYTTNSDLSAAGGPAWLSETTLRLNAESDWSSHSASVDAYGTFRKSLAGNPVEETEAGIDGQLELELGNEFAATATAGYSRQPESVDSPVEIVGSVSQPLLQTLNGSLGLAKNLGKARFSVTGRVEREWYGDAALSDGTTISQVDRNFTLPTLALRGGYEISPSLTPFVEVEYGRRIMDTETDASGYARSADRVAARGGVEFNLDEKLTGELSAGWIRETLDDARLAPIEGATVEADVSWSPYRGTTVGLVANTTVEGTTVAGESGSLLHTATVSLERRLRRDLTGSITLGAEWRDYIGSDDTDTTLSAEGSLTWWLNRYAGLTTRLRHETGRSTLPDGDYTANSVFLGVKLQR
ncbi:MAG: outer membrane beta-barrel protein [Rhizobiaceae bacterium]|nr:outer membrane beta-barrel protein [Rhizobiaceae bacterium]